MTCSKVFSGDLPELIDEIIQFLRNDYKTLHSCILVNRLWCRIAIPLLWEDPFSIPSRNYHFIEIYLHNLNDDDKKKLNECGFNSNLFPTNTLFDYPSFIKCLRISYIVDLFIKKWFHSVRILTKEHEQPFSYTLISKLIYNLLFKIFIESGATLHNFDFSINLDEDNNYFNNELELVLQYPNFICNIRNLKLNVTKNYHFFKFLCSNCKSIISLQIQFRSFSHINEEYLSQMINFQQNLKKFILCYKTFPLHHSLLLLKDSNCSNTLRTIIFYLVDFKNIVILKEVFEQLNVLESIHIIYCHSLNHYFAQQIISITKPFKLKSLFLSGLLHADSLEVLLQKSGDYLENFGFGIGLRLSNASKQQLLESVVNYCRNIKFLDIAGQLNNQNICPVFNLINNNQQNLNYLSIDAVHNNSQQRNIIELSSIILLNLGQILPLKLEYLNLKLIINTNEFEIFLKNSQNTFIKKLLIRNYMEKQGENILPYIKEYYMKRKRIKWLAIEVFFPSGRSEELFFLKDEVKEFESYNIKILKHNNLHINVYDFIEEID
ncbi:hypothetical protein C1645_873449 [Glomus cerebriforme]|uniref:F-box domain-containing protein n=1 Tax=Glomus cerebriforme TaxID=658196 RepID=A0A397T853_9GLOM|nr:hypothetical protein C1645_873449 [Glomus cerebriforme]